MAGLWYALTIYIYICIYIPIPMYMYIYMSKSHVIDCITGTGRMPSTDWMCHFCCSDDGIPSTFVCLMMISFAGSKIGKAPFLNILNTIWENMFGTFSASIEETNPSCVFEVGPLLV